MNDQVKKEGRDLRWPFEETWRTYDHVMFWVYSVGMFALGLAFGRGCR